LQAARRHLELHQAIQVELPFFFLFTLDWSYSSWLFFLIHC
jgi:hypothetical protein